MKLRPSFPDIPTEHPFANCKLEREPFALMLTSLLDNTEGGGTIALNGAWGTGKTVFIKMWQQHLNNKGYRTAYINSWEVDFIENPLTPILGEISHLCGKDTQAFKRVVKSLPKSILLGAEGFISSYTGKDSLRNLFKRHKSYDENIVSYCNQKDAIEQFRSELFNFVKTNCGSKPLVIFVDELDRCRPDYSVEFLEKIKHFLCVDNIIFVLSIDKKHLAESVKGHYGSSDINTDEYLRRFFDVEYELPEPDIKAFCEHIFNRESLNGIKREMEKGVLFDIILALVQNGHTTLRQIERYITQLKFCYSCYKELLLWHDLAAFLVFHKLFQPEIYQGLKSSSYDINKISEIFSSKYGKELLNEAHKGPYKMNYLAINLIYRYNMQLGNSRLYNFRTSPKIPEFSFNTGKIDQTYAVGLIQELERINDQITLSDIFQLIDISLPLNEGDLESISNIL